MFALWAFMICGYFGIGVRLKGKSASKRDAKDMTPLKLQFFNFTTSVAACLLEAIRRLLPLGSGEIVDGCMTLTILFVFFYCAAKWSTYSFLMVKVYIASKGEKAELLRKRKHLLLFFSMLLAVTCIAIVAVSQGFMFKDSGMCLWFLQSLLIAFFYPFGDLCLSCYLMYAFVKPLRESVKKTASTDVLKAIIRENVIVGAGCVISSFVIHIVVGVGVISKLRVQLITESLVCVDLLCNSIGLLYSTRRSWVRVRDNVEALTSVGSDAQKTRPSAVGLPPRGMSESIDNMQPSGHLQTEPEANQAIPNSSTVSAPSSAALS